MPQITNNTVFQHVYYHGSRGGIEGDIRPISRPKCDFGSGFYMGSKANQAKALVCMDQDPVLYALRIDPNRIKPENCYYLAGKEWMYAVLAFRNKAPEFTSTQVVQNLLAKISRYDVLIGVIADDRMGPAIKEFENNSLTDKGLMYCLSTVNYGGQVVAKTLDACNAIEIVDKHELTEAEILAARMYADKKRDEGRDIIDYAKQKFARDGLYYFELMENLSRNNSLDSQKYTIEFSDCNQDKAYYSDDFDERGTFCDRSEDER